MGHEALGNRVRFLIDRPRDEMPDLYRAADAFVLCSFKEMFPNALLEAMAAGLPSLVHPDPVHRWIVDEGGRCLDMNDAGALARAVSELLAPGAHHAMGAAARARAVRLFSKDVVLDQQIQMYREVLQP